MKSESSKPWQADVFPGLSEYLTRKRQPPREEGRFPSLAVGMIESLEARRLMSVSLSGGILTVTGTSGDDTYEIYQVNGSPAQIHVVENFSDLTDPAWTGTAVTRVDVSTLAGFDTVTIRTVAIVGRDPLSETTRIYGGADGDTLLGGLQADTIYGDGGDDSVKGSSDNDVLYGGYGGNDTVEGENGNDLMYGGNPAVTDEGDADTMRGGDGNDTLWAEGGHDVEVSGGLGNDLVYGGDGDDILDGDGGNDTIYAGTGADRLDPGSGADYAYGGDGNDTFSGSDDDFFDWLDGDGGTDSAGDYDSPGDSIFNFP